MADYGIDQALLGTRDPGVDPIGDLRVAVAAPYAQEKVTLLSTVARTCGCSAIQVSRRDAMSVHLFGHRSDLRRVEILFTSPLLQSSRQLIRTRVPWGEHKAAFRRTWLIGFAAAVGRRLTEAERTAEAGAEARFAAVGSTPALVRVRRGGEVEVAVQVTYPDLRTSPARVLSGSGAGAGAGFAFGQRVDLGNRSGVTSGSARRLPR